jgi:hypothetical protein
MQKRSAPKKIVYRAPKMPKTGNVIKTVAGAAVGIAAIGVAGHLVASVVGSFSK